MTRRAFSFATIGLVTFALIGIASYYRWRATDPLSVQLVSVGGEVRELQDSLGVTHRGVVHRIETHCYSPGVGLVVDVSGNVSPVPFWRWRPRYGLHFSTKRAQARIATSQSLSMPEGHSGGRTVRV